MKRTWGGGTGGYVQGAYKAPIDGDAKNDAKRLSKLFFSRPAGGFSLRSGRRPSLCFVALRRCCFAMECMGKERHDDATHKELGLSSSLVFKSSIHTFSYERIYFLSRNLSPCFVFRIRVRVLHEISPSCPCCSFGIACLRWPFQVFLLCSFPFPRPVDVYFARGDPRQQGCFFRTLIS